MELEVVENRGSLSFEQRFERQRVDPTAELETEIVILNVGSVGKFDAAFRTRRDEVRQLPDEIRKAEMRLRGRDRHPTKGSLAGLQFAIQLQRRQHFGAPVGMRVGASG